MENLEEIECRMLALEDVLVTKVKEMSDELKAEKLVAEKAKKISEQCMKEISEMSEELNHEKTKTRCLNEALKCISRKVNALVQTCDDLNTFKENLVMAVNTNAKIVFANDVETTKLPKEGEHVRQSQNDGNDTNDVNHANDENKENDKNADGCNEVLPNDSEHVLHSQNDANHANDENDENTKNAKNADGSSEEEEDFHVTERMDVSNNASSTASTHEETIEEQEEEDGLIDEHVPMKEELLEFEPCNPDPREFLNKKQLGLLYHHVQKFGKMIDWFFFECVFLLLFCNM